MNNKYTKVVYSSDPIGDEKIVLYLTTFDLEAFKKDEKMKEIPKTISAAQFTYERSWLRDNPNMLLEQMNKYYTQIIENTYKDQIEEMKSYIEYLRQNGMPQAKWYEANNETHKS